jgi:hypothetical protein
VEVPVPGVAEDDGVPDCVVLQTLLAPPRIDIAWLAV